MSIGTIIYGPRYIGKTAFTLALPKSTYWMTTARNSRKRNVTISGWERFTDTIVKLSEKQPYEYIVVDQFNRLYEMCVDYVCKQENEEHPSTSGNRKPLLWEKIKKEMSEQLFTLSDCANQIFYLTDMETKNLDSSLYKGTMMYPKLDWVLEDIMPHITQQTIAMVPTYKSVKRVSKATGEIAYVRKEKRVMICSARPDIYAGDSTGLLPKEFDAGESGEEAFNTYNSYMKKDK